MDRLFFDTNVLLDVLEQRAPWFPESSECLALARRGNCIGAFSVLSLSDIAYIQKAASIQNLCASFQILRSFLDIAPMNKTTVDAALARQLPDMEDGFQLEAALQWKATHLLTRNVKDFPRDSSLQILGPAAYLEYRKSSLRSRRKRKSIVPSSRL